MFNLNLKKYQTQNFVNQYLLKFKYILQNF